MLHHLVFKIVAFVTVIVCWNTIHVKPLVQNDFSYGEDLLI